MAGFVAEHILLKRLALFYRNELENLKPDDTLLDVRKDDEYRVGKIAHAINIPIDEIRSSLDEIPKEKNTYIYCEAGLRGYLKQRILKQNGFNNVLNLSGGYDLWKACVAETALAD